tara:strand:- start:439 stop:609 length:171 start_codon:yes stop_codon:yes gene_type:complete
MHLLVALEIVKILLREVLDFVIAILLHDIKNTHNNRNTIIRTEQKCAECAEERRES